MSNYVIISGHVRSVIILPVSLGATLVGGGSGKLDGEYFATSIIIIIITVVILKLNHPCCVCKYDAHTFVLFTQNKQNEFFLKLPKLKHIKHTCIIFFLDF